MKHLTSLIALLVVIVLSAHANNSSDLGNPLHKHTQKRSHIFYMREVDTWTYTSCCDGSQEATGLETDYYSSSGDYLFSTYVSQSPSAACLSCPA
jgi:hypothetical protein